MPVLLPATPTEQPRLTRHSRRTDLKPGVTLGSKDDYHFVYFVEGRASGAGWSLDAQDSMLIAPGDTRTVTSGAAAAVVFPFSPVGSRRPSTKTQRFSALRPLRDRVPVRFAPRIHDILAPRTLFPLVGPVAFGPGRFALVGPDELVVALVTTPKGTGPALHVHRYSIERFIGLRGEFNVTWGDDGEHSERIGPFDEIVIPTGHFRAFEAATDNAWLLPIVTGANDETEDIVYPVSVADQMNRVGPRLLSWVAQRRIKIGQRAPN